MNNRRLATRPNEQNSDNKEEMKTTVKGPRFNQKDHLHDELKEYT